MRGDIKTDVLIIGGGMAGLMCAHMLKEAGVDYLLCEANEICSGITKNTTAKITAQHGLVYHKLVRRFGTEKARMYLESNLRAVEEYHRLCADIDCGFETRDSYVYSLDNSDAIEREIAALSLIGYNADFSECRELPFGVSGAVRFPAQAQFNPLKFIAAIAANLNIRENTAVREMIGNTAVTDYGKIEAKSVIVATHFPFINKHGSYFIKMYQHRSYVVALENVAPIDGMYVDKDDKGMSFRSYEDKLLLGGGGHRTGKQGGAWRELRDFARRYYPDASEVCHWATQDCMTLDSVPYIGRYSSRTQDFYVATGFGKWGMTSSLVAAEILCDMVRGKRNEYAEVYSPSRTMIRPQLALNAFEAVSGIVMPSKKRCPHMGCALKWNKYENSWDCPCHGSRFSAQGKLIDNPATGDIE
ncbi:MAG: FAD-dependent oxidoreductase [Clostridia bacterium]|nr:FAD-dependent oxidoreductase [Clostridia bacterium]